MGYSDYDLECIEYIQRHTRLSQKLIIKHYESNGRNREKTLLDIKNKIDLGMIEITGAQASGIIYSNVSNASTLYGMDKFSTPKGHGFAAERANHLYDKFHGKDAQIVGDDNALNGADRVVDGINIQSKYCNSGSKCISECFKDGKFRYIDTDGSPMQIEVPSDKYEAAVKAMENRIKNGQLPGVNDPNKAKDIVRKGNFTYEQAKNIAKFGTIDSIKFDIANGVIIAGTTMGISSAITFAVSIWNGEDFNCAIRKATYSGLKVGGTAFITSILASQMSRAGLNSALVGSSEAIVSLMGPKAAATLVNAFRSGGNIYGAAAMKSAAKLLRGNIITGTISVAILSSVDVVNIFRGRISGAQLFKNFTNTATTVAGGTAGWIGGAAAGAAIGSAVPIIGTTIGGIAGGLLGAFGGGSIAGKVSNTVMSEFIEDDADEMVSIIQRVFQKIAEEYLLNQQEAEKAIDNLKTNLSGGILKDMFASTDREQFAKELLIPCIEQQVKIRKKIFIPSDKEIVNSLRDVLEEISDNSLVHPTI